MNLDGSEERQSGSQHAGRRARLLQLTGAVLAVTSCLYVVGGFWASEMGGGGEVALIDAEEPGAIDAERTPSTDTYCSVFADPAECERQRGSGQYKYWSAEEVKTELWKTMKALAELELREHAHHTMHKEKAEQQAKLFELFRKTMSREITDIHSLQEEMHKSHTAAFKRLALQLVDTATELKNYTDNGLGDVNARVTTLSAKQEEDSQRILVTLAQRVAEVHAKIESLHAESLQKINATQAYAEGVEAAMKSGDAQLLAQIQGLNGDLDALDEREGTHFGNLSAGLARAAAVQQHDRAELMRKIDGDVGALRENASQALADEKAEIRAKLGARLGDMRASIEALRQNITARAGALGEELTRVQTAQEANNAEQEGQIGTLRADFEAAKRTAFARMDAADARIEQAFGDLASAEARLRREANADKAMLLASLEGNATALREARERLEGWAMSAVADLNASVMETRQNLTATRARLEAQRVADMRALTDKIISDVSETNRSLHVRLDSDWTGLDARITDGLRSANARISAVNLSAWSNHHTLVQKVEGMEREAAAVDARQDAVLAELQRDSALEKMLVQARAAALEGNVTAAKERLARLSADVHRVQSEDRADIQNKVTTGISQIKTDLTAKVEASKQQLGSQIESALGGIQAHVAYLQGSSESQYNAVSHEVTALEQQQRLQDRTERAAIEALNATQNADASHVLANMVAVTAALQRAEGKLAAALSEVAAERETDAAAMKGRISSHVTAAEQRLRRQVAEAEAELRGELQAAVGRLEEELEGLRGQTDADYHGLQQNVSVLAAEQKIEDERQHAWLVRLQQAAADAAQATGERVAVLESEIRALDARQTQSAIALEQLQRNTARDINSTLHDAVAALRARILGELAENKNAISSAMEGGFGQLRTRVSALASASNTTATAIREAIFALGQQCHAKHGRRRSMMERISDQAEAESARFDARFDALEHLISQGRELLAQKVAEAQNAQNTAKAGMEAYVDRSVERVRGNATLILSRTEGGLRTDLGAEVRKWTQELAKLAGDSGSEAVAIKAAIEHEAAQGAAQHASVMGAVQRLVESVTDSKNTADAAVAALRLGLEQANRRLNSTAEEVRGEAAEAAAETRARIEGGLARLRANFSSTMAQQQEEARQALAARADAVEAKVERLRGEMRGGMEALNRSVETLGDKEATASARHAAEIARMLQAHTASITALQTTVTALKTALESAESRLGSRSGVLLEQQRQGLEELHAKLQRAVERLQAATSDVSDRASQKLVVAEGKLNEAKAEVEQTQEELKRRHASDTEEVKAQITAGLIELEGRVSASIAQSLAAVRQELGEKMAALRTKVAEVKGQAASTEQSLQGKMSDLSATEATNDAAQDRQIAELLSRQQQMKASALARAQGIAGNLSAVQAALRSDYADLDRDRLQDRNDLLTKIQDSMARARDSLVAELQQLKTQLTAGVTQAMSGANTRVTEERESVEAAIAAMEARLRVLRTESAGGAADAEVTALEQRIAQIRAEVARNSSGLHTAMQQLVVELQTEQNRGRVQQQADIATFQRESAAEAAELRSNFTGELAEERAALLVQVRSLVDGLKDAVDNAVGAPQATLGELNDRLTTLQRDLRMEYQQRWREIRAINSTTLNWANGMLARVVNLQRQLSLARQQQQTGNAQSRRNINLLRAQLNALRIAASRVGDVEVQLNGLRSRVETVQNTAESEYASTGSTARSAQEQAQQLQQDLQSAVAQLNADLASETATRQRSFTNTTGQLSALRARVEWIEEELRRLQLLANQTPPPAPEEEPVMEDFPPPDHPAPPYEAPPIPPGHTPPPFPLLFWDYRTQQAGLDEEYANTGAGVRLGAATSGTLSGSINFPAAGRWSVFLVLHAAEGGDASDEVTVTVNGAELGTFNNNGGGGFPCGTRGCLNAGGLYVASADIRGSTMEYTLTWSSSNSDPAKHMMLGVGQAAFLGTDAAPPAQTARRGEAAIEMEVASAMDAKTLKTGVATSDGLNRRGYSIPQDARLVVLDGSTAIAETTLQNGKAKVAVPAAQSYSCVVTLPGYMHFFDDDCQSLAGEKNHALMSPILKPGTSRIVLQWARRPSDLDVYLLAPHRETAQPPCEVNFRQKQCHSGTVKLDKDDVNGHGPETLTIEHFNPGQYVLRVDDYRGNPNAPLWDISHAFVTYYSPHLGAIQFHVAHNGYTEGDVWYVMAVDGETRNPVECTREICPLRPRP